MHCHRRYCCPGQCHRPAPTLTVVDPNVTLLLAHSPLQRRQARAEQPPHGSGTRPGQDGQPTAQNGPSAAQGGPASEQPQRGQEGGLEHKWSLPPSLTAFSWPVEVYDLVEG